MFTSFDCKQDLSTKPLRIEVASYLRVYTGFIVVVLKFIPTTFNICGLHVTIYRVACLFSALILDCIKSVTSEWKDNHVLLSSGPGMFKKPGCCTEVDSLVNRKYSVHNNVLHRRLTTNVKRTFWSSLRNYVHKFF